MSEIEKFTKRTKTATNARSKDIRLTLVEAQTLSLDLVTLLESKNKLLEQISNLQKTIISLQESNIQHVSSNDFEIRADGGSFKS